MRSLAGALLRHPFYVYFCGPAALGLALRAKLNHVSEHLQNQSLDASLQKTRRQSRPKPQLQLSVLTAGRQRRRGVCNPWLEVMATKPCLLKESKKVPLDAKCLLGAVLKVFSKIMFSAFQQL